MKVHGMTIALRPLQALALWRDVNLDLVRDAGPDLSSRQVAVLLTVYLDPPPHTVRALAETLKVGKPAITRALDTLGRLGLLSRRRDDADKRNVVVQRTLAGALAVEKLADIIAARAKDLPR
jgi:DNA-binding MarR family transcriptional regulator